MNRVNKPAGFWIRFLARLLDYVLLAVLTIVIAFFLMKHVKYENTFLDDKGNPDVYHSSSFIFLEHWQYYTWGASTFVLVWVLFVFIPWLTNGRTIFMLVCRIKIVFTKNKLLSLFQRELFMALGVAINIALIMILFDKDIFNKFARSDVQDYKAYLKKYGQSYFSDTENLRISIVTTLASLLFVGQLIIGVSIIVRKQRKGLNDSFSETRTIWEKRYIDLKEKTEEEGINSFAPHLVKKEIVEWIE